MVDMDDSSLAVAVMERCPSVSEETPVELVERQQRLLDVFEE